MADFFADDMTCITSLFLTHFNAICNTFTVRLIAGQVTLRTGLAALLFYRIRHMMIDDSTTKNTRLLDSEFIPKTEHLDLIFCPVIPTSNLT